MIFGGLNRTLRIWTGAPGSHQRTWAENDTFRLLFLIHFAKAMVGFARISCEF
jgi:hypothetical protein